jgi:hypothetical protein
MLSYISRKFNRSNINFRLALLVTVFVVGATGCAKLKSDNSAAPSGGHTNASAPSSGPATAPPSSGGPGKPTSWEETATSLKSADGQTMILACSPAGEPHTVWGSDIYTSDSSICTAAVHSGLITFQQGGTVTIELRPGRSVYGSSERNGVTSNSFGSWQQSFVFKTPNTDAVVRAAEESTAVMWNTGAAVVPFEAGKTLKVNCPANGKESSVWGTDTYTADSSICTAAVHAGKLKLETGGPVTIQLTPGESSYKGSVRNGIKTNDYESYGASFIVK